MYHFESVCNTNTKRIHAITKHQRVSELDTRPDVYINILRLYTGIKTTRKLLTIIQILNFHKTQYLRQVLVIKVNMRKFRPLYCTNYGVNLYILSPDFSPKYARHCILLFSPSYILY